MTIINDLAEMESWLIGKGYSTKAKLCAEIAERVKEIHVLNSALFKSKVPQEKAIDRLKEQLRYAQESMLKTAKEIQDYRSRINELEKKINNSDKDVRIES
jgi:chromosome segregation ATPase